MPFDKHRDPGDELEDYGDELTSDYEEEGEAGRGAEEVEEELSYEVEESAAPVQPPSAPEVVELPEPTPAEVPAPAKPVPSGKVVKKREPRKGAARPAERAGRAGTRAKKAKRVERRTKLQRLRVFLCHASRDKPAVRRLYWRLRTEQMEPWLDEQDILPGQKWEEQIRKAVASSDVVVVCLSRTSVSTAGYVQKEIKLALDLADQQPEGAVFLIPVRLERCRVPERLSGWQWVNLFEKGGYERLVHALQERRRTSRF